ncbi:MAG: DNA polymerase III subunit beta [Acidimicrobiales bacterium]|nr:MAG: DNA polymerase III subunit beta [Acidimicrobiales bacterium]
MAGTKVQLLAADRARIWARRRAEQAYLLELARDYERGLGLAGVRAVVVFGSVARGDFNLGSDVDVLVVVDDLPERLRDRLELLSSAVPRVQALGWTSDELATQLRRGDPIAVGIYETGVVIQGTLPGQRL